ncbi:MAG: DUF1614 domain-containing protein, partial [Halobacteriota archaeon]
MLVESVSFLLLAFLILLLLVVGFETVGFKLSEAVLIFVGSTLLFLISFPSILLYFDGFLGIGIIDVPLRILAFQGFLVVGPRSDLAIGFDVAGFLIPFFISLRMIFDRRSPIRASLIGIACIAAVSYLTSAYVAGEGVVIFNIGHILTYRPRGFAFASIGGAGVFDAIFLVGVLAVTIDVIFVENVRL